jgi:putative ABC transport system permease protein
MLKNFLTVALRNLLKNKVYVFINIVGLGLALACCIVAYQNSKFNWDFDRSHTQIDHIYKILSIRDNKGEIHEYGRVPFPMADLIKNDLPSVDRVFRYESHVFTARDEKLDKDKVFNTSLIYADPGFLESFTFPVVSGDPKAYLELDRAVVTQEYAHKFYGDEDPMGRVLTIFDDTGMSFNFVIGAVVSRAPLNSSVNFEVLVNFDNRYRMYDDKVKGNWESFAQNTFVYLEDPDKAREIESLLDQYLPAQQEARPDFTVAQFVLSPMNEHAHIARNIRWDNLGKAMPSAAVLTPQIMALLILLVACFNFTNTAIANSNRRLKEIGVRKVLGGNRNQLIKQFMIENLTICLLGLILGISIAIYLVPAYGAMWEGMDIQMKFSEDIMLYVFFALLLIFTTIIAGLYPSLYISKYNPVSILRGSVSIKGTSMLTRILLATQYAFTAIAIFASVAFIQNAHYQDTLDLGYDQGQVIGISLLNEEQYQKVRTSMEANPDIVSYASAKNHIGRGNYGRTIKHEETEVDVNMMDVGINYIETMGLEINTGRSFDPKLEASDSKHSIVINQKMVEAFGWDDPIGKRVTINDTIALNVVGVVENFYLYGFWAPLEPLAFRLSSLRFEDDGTYSFIVARTDVSNVTEVYDYLESEWNDQIPNKTFAGFYQDELLSEAKKTNRNILLIFGFLGTVAFVLSCLGLFTMVSINLVKRTKEIGVRKVLGGSMGHLVFLITRSYFILLFISSVIGITAGYYLIDGLIASIFNNYKSFDLLTFLLPFTSILAISLLIAGLRTFQSANANPVNSLRYE